MLCVDFTCNAGHLSFITMHSTRFDSATMLWSGAKSNPVFNPNVSIGQAILWTLEKDPNKIAQVRFRITSSRVLIQII